MKPYARLVRLLFSGAGLTPRFAGVFCLTWLAVIVGSAVTIPLKYPNADYGKFMDNGLVVGLAIPVTVAARLLDESMTTLTATAHRRTWAQRVLVAVGILGATLVGVLLVMVVVTPQISRPLLLADCVLLLGLSLLGTTVLGGDVGFIGVLIVVLVMSSPGAIPPDLNILYNVDRRHLTVAIAIVAWCTGLIAYTARGSLGPRWRRRLTNDIHGVNQS